MHEYALTHLSDTVLLRELSHLVKQDRATTARLIAHLAEVDARRLYAPAGHPSMFAYCVEELHFSEDSAYKRIRAARAARQFPALFAALADGRIHLAAVSLLAPHMTPDNVEELIDAATHRSKADIDAWVARRFGVVAAVKAPPAVIRPLAQLAPGRVVSALGDMLAGTVSAAAGAFSTSLDASEAKTNANIPGSAPPADGVGSEQPAKTRAEGQLAPGQEDQLAPGRVATAPSLEERYSMHLTIPKSMHDKIRRAQCMLSHTIPSGDVVKVLERALDLLLSHEGRRIGSTRSTAAPNWANEVRGTAGVDQSEPPSSSRVSSPRRTRYIPARVRRAVWERDQGQCTFVTHAGHRCSARRFLEFDHVEPVARGGSSTVEGLRLRCRTHNQYAAEETFGAEFMQQKRERARRERAAQRELGCRALNQPDRVREPSGSWCLNHPRARVGRTTRPGAQIGQLAPGRVQTCHGVRSSARLGRPGYREYARPTVILRPGAG